MQKIWFTSDTHFQHKKIFKHCPKRLELLKDVSEDNLLSEHDKMLIDIWNSNINKKDIVYHLGDFSFANAEENKKLLGRLNGEKFLIIGNHDKSSVGLTGYFKQIIHIKEVMFKKNNFPFLKEDLYIVMSHFPMLTWNRKHYGAVHLHGHEHGHIDMHNFVNYDLRFDVGLDSHLSNFRPLSLEDVNRLVERKTTGYSIASYIERYKRQMLF